MKVRWHVLKGHPEAPLLVLDLVVLLLISLNLAWLIVDAVLLGSGVGVILEEHFPRLIAGYRDDWHRRLLVYDTYFTLFLIAELLLRWGIAIVRRTYYRWFFYPFVHWYDVLGCIPLPFFRMLRLLRLFSIAYRLQALGIIDLSGTSLLRVLHRYYRIVIEELSDRIVVNVLEGMQREIRSGGTATHRLAEEVLRPQRNVIVPWLSDLITDTGAHAHALHRERLRRYLDEVVREAIAGNPDLQRIKRRLLFVGPAVEEELQSVVAGLLQQTIDRALTDLGQRGNIAAQDIAAGLFDTVVSPHTARDAALREILIDALELIKAQVAVQQWKAPKAPSGEDG